MVFLLLVIIIIFINFFRRVFSECIEVNATSLILSEIYTFTIGFNCTVCAKMRSLAGSLADSVLADAILIPPRPLIPPTNISLVRVSRKSTATSSRKKIY